MRIFVAGATGAIGKQLVPRLVERGHEVVGTTRSEAKAALLEELGAKAAVLDALDADAVGEAVGAAAPDAVVHQLTAISDFSNRSMDRSFAATNRLRTEGTDILLAAARAAGVRRFVAQSYAAWPYERVGGPVKTEEDPLDDRPPKNVTETLDAIKYLERAVTGAEGMEAVVLRYGMFYGPGTSLTRGGEHFEAVEKRKFPLVGEAGGVWSFIHIADAADATVAAVEGGDPGIYNVVDDEPAEVADWLPVAAQAVGAKPPRHVPVWVARLLAGDVMTVMVTDIRGASNAKAKRELGWTPAHPSWRQGFAEAAA